MFPFNPHNYPEREVLLPHFKFLNFYLFLERGEGREKEKERNINVREKHQSVASLLCPDQGHESAT